MCVVSLRDVLISIWCLYSWNIDSVYVTVHWQRGRNSNLTEKSILASMSPGPLIIYDDTYVPCTQIGNYITDRATSPSTPSGRLDVCLIKLMTSGAGSRTRIGDSCAAALGVFLKMSPTIYRPFYTGLAVLNNTMVSAIHSIQFFMNISVSIV